MSEETPQDNHHGNVEYSESKKKRGSSRSICSPWLSFCTWFHEKMEKLFSASGTKIANHPVLTILIGFLLVGCLSIGFIWFKMEKRTVKIFIPQDSESMKDLARADKHFKLNLREENIILIPQKDKQIVSVECLKDALRVHFAVTRLPSYTELCAKSKSSKCILLNPLELFNFEEKNMENVSTVIKEKTACPSPIVMSNGRSSCQNLNRMFGSVQHQIRNFSQVKAIRMSYYLEEPENDDDYNTVTSWESDFMNTLSALQKNLLCVKILSAAERTLDDAIDESSSSDITYLSLTFTVMITFANIILGKMFTNPLTSHSLLGTSGVICVGLGIAAGFGLSLISQTPFVQIVGVLPFLVLGVAIDDMFIILDDLDRQSKDLSVPETVSLVMSRTGPTVTMTTITDLVAFAVSTSSHFPSVQYFCTYAALTIFFAYLLIVTVFVALMSFDVKRIKANRRDYLPICLAPARKDGKAWDDPKESLANKIMEKYAQLLMKPAVKAFVVLLSLGLLGAGIYGTVKTDESFSTSLLARDGSPYKNFLAIQDKYFDDAIGFNVVVDQPLNYSTKESQTALQKLGDIVRTNKFCKTMTVSWIDEYISYCLAKRIFPHGPLFYDNLITFLNEPVYRSYASDIKLSDDNKTIVASRVIGFIKGSGSSIFQRDAMLSLREDLSSKSSIQAYPITKPFIFLEQYAIIVTETIRNLAVASVTILIITSPFLVDIIIIFLVFLSFVALVFELFGLMAIWGVSLNSISMINLVMAIGFSVDYSAHIALAFLKSKAETSEERVVDSMKSVGASVAMGGISTLLGVVFTALSDSEIFRIFFKMFLGIVVLGLLHGLLFLPVYLGIFGRWSKRFQLDSSSKTQVNPSLRSHAEENEDRETIECQPRKDVEKKTVGDTSENTSNGTNANTKDDGDNQVSGAVVNKDGETVNDEEKTVANTSENTNNGTKTNTEESDDNHASDPDKKTKQNSDASKTSI